MKMYEGDRRCKKNAAFALASSIQAKNSGPEDSHLCFLSNPSLMFELQGKTEHWD